MKKHATQEVFPRTRTLSDYIASAACKAPPRDVIERTKMHLAETFAARISRLRLQSAQVATTHVHRLDGKPSAGMMEIRLKDGRSPHRQTLAAL